MKTKAILGGLFFCLSGVIFAQESDSNVNYPDTMPSKPTKKATFWMGPKFGLDLRPVKFNDVGNQLSNNYQFGLFMQFGRTLYLQPEVYYASKKIQAFGEKAQTSNSIRVPVMIGLRFIDLGLFSLHAMTGPAFNFQLDDFNAKASDDIKANPYYIADKQAFSWEVGAGIDVLGFITTDLRYTLDSGKSLGDQINGFDKFQNNINLTVGLKFR